MRLLPFFSLPDAQKRVASYIDDFNNYYIPHSGDNSATSATLRKFGYDTYRLTQAEMSGNSSGSDARGINGFVEFNWHGAGYPGVAVDLESLGYKALSDAIFDVCGEVKAFSLTGSLPIIADLKAQGFDTQVCGFGDLSAYHAANEHARVSGFQKGVDIVARVVASLNRLM